MTDPWAFPHEIAPRKSATDLSSALRDFAGQVEQRFAHFEPASASEGERALLEDLALLVGELRAASAELEDQARRLEEERSRSDFLFEAAPYPYLLADSAGTILQANRAATAFFGLHPERAKGKPIANLIALGERQAFRDRLKSLLSARQDAWSDWEGTAERPGAPARVALKLRVAHRADDGAGLVFCIARSLEHSGSRVA